MSDKIEEYRKRRQTRLDIVKFHKRRDERIALKYDAEFVESDHPRAKNGQFTSKGNGEVSAPKLNGGSGETSERSEGNLSKGSANKNLVITEGAELRNAILSDTGKMTIDDIVNHPIVKAAQKKYNESLGEESPFSYKDNSWNKVGANETIRIQNDPKREKLRNDIAKEMNQRGSFSGKEKKVIDGKEVSVEKFEKPVQKGFRCDIVIGAPAGGKSSTLVNPISEQFGSRIIDSDEVKKMLPEFDGGNGAGIVHKESSDIIMAEKMLPEYYKGGSLSGDNVVIPIVGKDPKYAREYLKKFKEAGYDVHLSFNDVTDVNSAKRATTRYIEEGRFLSPEYIKSIGNKAKESYETLKNEGGFASYTMYDNNVPKGEHAKLVEQLGEKWDIKRKDGVKEMEGKGNNVVITEQEKRMLYDYLKECEAEDYMSMILDDEFDTKFFLEQAKNKVPASRCAVRQYFDIQ